jgi:hypothetical protein
MPTYIEASQKSTTRAIWDKFFLRYWAAFPWRLPLEQDPDPDDPTNYAAKPVDEAEEDAKSKLIEKMEDVGCVLVICDKILTWMAENQGLVRTAEGGVVKPNLWTDWLKRLHAPTAAAPRKLADYQYYMQHPDYKDQISVIFKEHKVAVADKKKAYQLTGGDRSRDVCCRARRGAPENGKGGNGRARGIACKTRERT